RQGKMREHWVEMPPNGVPESGPPEGVQVVPRARERCGQSRRPEGALQLEFGSVELWRELRRVPEQVLHAVEIPLNGQSLPATRYSPGLYSTAAALRAARRNYGQPLPRPGRARHCAPPRWHECPPLQRLRICAFLQPGRVPRTSQSQVGTHWFRKAQSSSRATGTNWMRSRLGLSLVQFLLELACILPTSQLKAEGQRQQHVEPREPHSPAPRPLSDPDSTRSRGKRAKGGWSRRTSATSSEEFRHQLKQEPEAAGSIPAEHPFSVCPVFARAQPRPPPMKLEREQSSSRTSLQSPVRRLNKDFHLLSHVKWDILIRESEDRLKNPGIDSLRAVTSKGLLGDNIRLETNEFERCAPAAVATLGRFRRTSRFHAPGIVLVDVGPNMKFAD